jgi:DHA2 family multidrug resistance protein-like MFS transporter
MIGAAPLHRSGAAGGMLATARLFGQAVGAVAVAVFFHFGGTRAATEAMICGSALAALAALVSLTRQGAPSSPP